MDTKEEQLAIEEAEKDIERYVEADYDSKVTAKRGRLIRKLKKLRKKISKKEEQTEEDKKLLERIDSLLDKTIFKHKIQLKERYNHEFLEGDAKVPDVITTLPKGIILQAKRVVNCIREIQSAKGMKAKLVGFGNFAKNTGLLVATPVIFAGKFAVEHWYLVILLFKWIKDQFPNLLNFFKKFKKDGKDDKKDDNGKDNGQREDVSVKNPSKYPFRPRVPIIPPFPVPGEDKEKGKEPAPSPVPEPKPVPVPVPAPVLADQPGINRATRKQLDDLIRQDKIAKGVQKPIPVPPVYSPDDKVNGQYVYPEVNPQEETSPAFVPPVLSPIPSDMPSQSFAEAFAFGSGALPTPAEFAEKISIPEGEIFPTIEDAIKAIPQLAGLPIEIAKNEIPSFAKNLNLTWVIGQGGLFNTIDEFNAAMGESYTSCEEILNSHPEIAEKLNEVVQNGTINLPKLVKLKEEMGSIGLVGAGAFALYELVKLGLAVPSYGASLVLP